MGERGRRATKQMKKRGKYTRLTTAPVSAFSTSFARAAISLKGVFRCWLPLKLAFPFPTLLCTTMPRRCNFRTVLKVLWLVALAAFHSKFTPLRDQISHQSVLGNTISMARNLCPKCTRVESCVCLFYVWCHDVLAGCVALRSTRGRVHDKSLGG